MGGRKAGGTRRRIAETAAAKTKALSVTQASLRKGSVLRESDTGTRYSGARETSRRLRGAAASRALSNAGPLGPLSDQLEVVAAKAASGRVRRKNMNMDQGLLDTVIAASGATSETAAVRLGLAAYVEIAAFERAMLTGFDRWSSQSGFALEGDAPIDTGAFLARSAKARKIGSR